MNWTPVDGLGYNPLHLLEDKLSLSMAQKLGQGIILQSSIYGFKTARVKIIPAGGKS